MEIPGFEQCEKIAESGFASYWQAYQRSLDRHVTLILLRPDSVSDPETRRAFLRDIRGVANLKHPALFQVYDVVELDAALVVVVEHLSGLSLRHYVRQRGAVKEEKALTIGRWIAEGLSHVYEKTGLMHLALTPDQIWINDDGQVKILGFGFRDILERIGYSPADIPYLAPEQIERRSPADLRADLYTLGSVLYYMATGCAPFEGYAPEQILSLTVKGQLPAPMTLAEGTSMAFNQLLARLMMKDPANRHPGWLPAMQEMDKVLNGAKFLVNTRKSGLSTILLPGAPARPSAAAGGGERGSAAEKPPVSRASAAATLGVLLLVLAFWVWLGWTLWKMPPAPPPAAPPALAPAQSPAAAGEDERPSARVRVVRRPSILPVAAESTNAPAPRPAADPFDELTDKVVRHLVAGEAGEAMLAVDAAARSPDWASGLARLDDLRGLLSRGADPEALVLAGLRQKLGQKINLQMNGRMTEVTVNRIEGRNVVVTEDTLSGTVALQKHVTLNVAALSLGEQARLMASGREPEFAVARMILFLKGGAKDRASALAPQTGCLSPAFQRYLEAQP